MGKLSGWFITHVWNISKSLRGFTSSFASIYTIQSIEMLRITGEKVITSVVMFALDSV